MDALLLSMTSLCLKSASVAICICRYSLVNVVYSEIESSFTFLGSHYDAPSNKEVYVSSVIPFLLACVSIHVYIRDRSYIVHCTIAW